MEKKLLYVEDSQDMRLLMKMVFKRVGIETVVSVTGEEGLDQFIQNRDDLMAVITDYQLGPGMDGVELISEIRKLDQHIPIILASGTVTPSLEERSRAAGASMTVDKFNTISNAETLKALLAPYRNPPPSA